MNPRALLAEKWMFYIRTGQMQGKQLGELFLPPFGERVPQEVRRKLYEILFAHREMVLFGDLLEPQAVTMKIEGSYPKTIKLRWKKRLDMRWNMKRDNIVAVVTQREA